MRSGTLLAVMGLGAVGLLLLGSRSSAAPKPGTDANPCTAGLPPQIAALVDWALSAPRGETRPNPYGTEPLEIQPGPLYTAADMLEGAGYKDAATCLRIRARELEPKSVGG